MLKQCWAWSVGWGRRRRRCWFSWFEAQLVPASAGRRWDREGERVQESPRESKWGLCVTGSPGRQDTEPRTQLFGRMRGRRAIEWVTTVVIFLTCQQSDVRSCELLACSLFLERHLAGFAALYLSGLWKCVLFKDIAWLWVGGTLMLSSRNSGFKNTLI